MKGVYQCLALAVILPGLGILCHLIVRGKAGT